MNAMAVTLKNRELAEHLAHNLSDLEFELLVRARIAREFQRAMVAEPELYESIHSCAYQHSFTEQGQWRVRIGNSYSDSVSAEGEVLTATMTDAIQAMDAKHRNKLSLLLPAPSDKQADLYD
jgi:hypothetical protein